MLVGVNSGRGSELEENCRAKKLSKYTRPAVTLGKLLKLSKPHLTSSIKCIRRRQWHPTPVLLPGKSHGWRSLVGCSSQGHTESDTTEAT